MSCLLAKYCRIKVIRNMAEISVYFQLSVIRIFSLNYQAKIYLPNIYEQLHNIQRILNFDSTEIIINISHGIEHSILIHKQYNYPKYWAQIFFSTIDCMKSSLVLTWYSYYFLSNNLFVFHIFKFTLKSGRWTRSSFSTKRSSNAAAWIS